MDMGRPSTVTDSEIVDCLCVGNLSVLGSLSEDAGLARVESLELRMWGCAPWIGDEYCYRAVCNSHAAPRPSRMAIFSPAIQQKVQNGAAAPLAHRNRL